MLTLTTKTIPPLEAFNPGIRPTGFNILVGLPPKETKSAGGIIIPDSTNDRERLGEVRGRIVAMSPACFDFADFPKEERPNIGDAVVFAKFAGIVTEGADGNEYRVILDKDIVAVVDEPASSMLEAA